jgi:hypothetical protein
MYELLGNVMFIWFSIGLYNYGATQIGYKKGTLADMALRSNVSHISTYMLDVPVETIEVTTPAPVSSPIKYKWWLWWMSGEQKTEVISEKSEFTIMSKCIGQKTSIDSSNCDTHEEIIPVLKKYEPLKDISNYITDISNCKMLDCIEKTAHQYTDFDAKPYKIPFISKIPVLLSCTSVMASFFRFTGVTKLIERWSVHCMNYMGFNHCEKFGSNGESVWTREVPNTEPIVFFPEPGIGFQFVYWGHYLKSLERTVYILGRSHNDIKPAVVDKKLSPKLSPKYRFDIFKLPIYLEAAAKIAVHDIIADSSRKIDAENYINAIIAYTHFLTVSNDFLTVSNVKGFEFKDTWAQNRTN